MVAPLNFGPGGGFSFGGGGNTPEPPARPAAFTLDMWTLAPTATPGQLAVTIDSLPDDRGSAILDIEYRIGAGSWVSTSGTTGFEIDDRPAVPTTVFLRAINANGAGAVGPSQSAMPLAPPNIWQDFAMNAETSIDWVGYVAPGYLVPAGSISREPNPAHPLRRLVYSPTLDVIVAEFEGDVSGVLEGFSMFIGGYEERLLEASYADGVTEAHYETDVAAFLPGSLYEIEFRAATPATVPSAPTLTATAGDGVVTVGWTDGEDGGAEITSRRLYRSTTSGFTPGAGNLIETNPTFPYEDESVTNGTTYYYKGIAANVMGDSPASTQQTATPEVVPVPSDDTPKLIYDYNNKEFVVTNADQFSGASWSWSDEDGDPISGQTSPVLAYSNAPEGKYVRVVATTSEGPNVSNYAIAPLDLSVITETFDGVPNGTNVNGWEGELEWMGRLYYDLAYIENSYQIIDGALYQTRLKDHGDGVALAQSVPLGDKSITLKNAFDRTQTSNTAAASSRYIFLDYTDKDNYILVRTLNYGCDILERVGGVLNENTFGWSLFNFSNDVTVTRLNGRLHVYRDGEELPNSASMGGLPVTCPHGPIVGTGSYFDWTVAGQPVTWPVRVCTELEVRELPSKTFSLIDVTVGDPDEENPIGSITLEGVAPSGVTEYDWSFVGANGEQLTPWVSGVEVEAGEWAISVPLPPNVAGTSDARIALRPTDDIESITITPLGNVEAFEAVAPIHFGVNSSGAPAFGATDMLNDRGYVTNWRYWVVGGAQDYIPQSDLTEEGFPKYPAPAGSEIVGIVFEHAPTGIREKTWTLTTNAPSVITRHVYSGMSISNVTSTGCTITQETGAPSYQLMLQFAGVVPPPEGFKISVLPVDNSLPSEDYITPEYAAMWHADNFGGKMTYRNMKLAGTEGAGLAPPDIRIPQGLLAGAASRQMGADIHYAFPYKDVADHLETKVREAAEQFLLTAGPNAIMIAEVGNEVWNSQYWKQYNLMAANAANHGLIDGVVVPEGTVVFDATLGDVEMGSGLTNRVMNPGEMFYASAAGWQHVIAKVISPSPVPIGTVVPATTDSNFEILARYDPIYEGMRREQTYQQARLGNYLKSFMGNRVKSYYGVWLLDNPADVVRWMLHGDAYKGIDCYAPSFYSGSAVAYESLPWADKHTTDFSAFKAGYFAKYLAGIDDTVDTIVAMKHAVRSGLRQGGVAPEDCPVMDYFYEGGDHNTILHVPTEERAGLTNAVLQCTQSEEEYDANIHMWTRFKNEVGGTFIFFSDIEKPVYNVHINQAQAFGMRQFLRDFAANNNGDLEQRYKAAVDFFSGNPI